MKIDPKTKNFLRPRNDEREHCFIPHKKIEHVFKKYIVDDQKVSKDSCPSNLLRYHMKKVYPLLHKSKFNNPPFYVYLDTIRNAIMSQDWDKLVFLLLQYNFHSVSYEKCHNAQYSWDYYTKAFIILLLNHPIAKQESMLSKYAFLALGCRSDDIQKVLMKLLLTLPDKTIYRVFYGNIPAVTTLDSSDDEPDNDRDKMDVDKDGE